MCMIYNIWSHIQVHAMCVNHNYIHGILHIYNMHFKQIKVHIVVYE